MINTYEFQLEHRELFKQFAVRELLFLHYKCPQSEKKIDLYTPLNKIVYVLSGKKTIRQSENSWDLVKDTCFLVRKTAYNQERFYDIDWEVLCFYLPDAYLKQVWQQYQSSLSAEKAIASKSDMLIQIDVNDSTRAFFYSIVPYFSQSVPPSEVLLELKFRELLINILDNPANTAVRSYIKSINDYGRPHLHEIMEANYMYNLPLSEFAKITNRSLATFNRDFREYYNTTPGRWLCQKRLSHSRTLLAKTNMNVNEISMECGFENPTHFSRLFKEQFGLSPLQHRKQSTRSNYVDQ